MNILVCVKQVRESSSGDAMWILNPADACAVEMALQLKAKQGGKVSVMTMGRERAEEMLRELIARGVDRAILVSDAVYAGSDTQATAQVLYKAVQKTGPYDCILTGRRAVDGETALTPARLALLLGWPLITDVKELCGAQECVCESDSVERRLQYALPAVLTVREGSCALRLMGILGMRRAKNAVIERLGNEQLRLSVDQVGLNGSPTRVHRVTQAPEASRSTKWLHTGADIVCVLREHSVAKDKKQTVFCSAPKVDGSIWVLAEQEDADARALVCRAQALSNQPMRLIRIKPVENTLELAYKTAEYIRGGQPAALLCLSTAFLRRLVPQIATCLQTGLTADCTDLRATDSGLLLQIRPTYGGAQLAEILCPEKRPQMALVRSGVFAAEQPAKEYETVDILCDDQGRVKCLSAQQTAPNNRLQEADLLVAGGYGLGGREQFEALATLAQRLGGKAAATRAAVDAGYAPYALQVGQTGLTVRPQIYLAMGVSGAIQHVLGMKESGLIISVNTDPKAPIFHYSDYGLVGDCGRVMKEMEEALS